MKLSPTIPPGRPNRKARAFEAEIARLCEEGYGCKAIHQALTAAGVSVSKSTVQREVARLSKPSPPAARPSEAGLVAAPERISDFAGSPSQDTALPRLSGGVQSSKDFAAEFMKSRITNPLFRKRS